MGGTEAPRSDDHAAPAPEQTLATSKVGPRGPEDGTALK